MLELRWGTSAEAMGTFALLAQGGDARNLTFALRDNLVDAEQGLRIPWRSVTTTGPTELQAGQITSFTATAGDVPGPGTYPFTLYAQADGMDRPARLRVELRVLPGARLSRGDRLQKARAVTEDQFELRFTAESPGRALHGVRFAMSQPVTAEEYPTKSLLPTHVSVLTPQATRLQPGERPGPLPLPTLQGL